MLRQIVLTSFVFALIAVLPSANDPALGATLLWNANTEPDLAGYRVYRCSQLPCQKTSSSATLLATLGTTPGFNIGAPAVVQYYFMTAYDFGNNESGASAVATYIPPTSNPGGIQGVAFEDINLDGQRDPGEPALAGRTIYIDANSNDVRDAGEPSTITDAAGAYQFTALGPGSYRVGQELPPQWLATAPASITHSVDVTSGAITGGRDFGALALTLDLDRNGRADALSDGTLIVRYLTGFRDLAMINGVVDPFGSRTDPRVIAAYLDRVRAAMLDVDSNGVVDGLSDGILIIRYLFGLTGDPLISGAADPRGQRTTSEAIIAFLNPFLPPSQRAGSQP